MHPLWSAGRSHADRGSHQPARRQPARSGRTTTGSARGFRTCRAPYDAALRALARAVALEQRITLREGVYVAVTGPNLETRAEYRMLRAIGADVVGMSHGAGGDRRGARRACACSAFDHHRQCLPETLEPAKLERDHRDAARGAEPQLTALVRGVLERI